MAQLTEGDLQIGGSTEHGDFFNGRIDEVRIYNRALGGGEVAADQAAPIQTPQQTPIAAYSFDEGEGETAEDLTGDGHTATIEGAEWSTHGRYGSALEFDASEEDVLKVPDSPELDFSEEFTLEAWVHPSGEESSWAPIVAKQQGGGKGAHRYAYWLHESWEGANYPAGGFETTTEGQDREAIPSEHLSENHWTHLAISFDGAKLRLYVDGELVKDASTTGMAQLTEGDLQIGGSTEHGDFFNGRIDEVRIYNRALGAGEIVPDRTPPTAPSGFDAILEDEEGDATIGWNGSIDPVEPPGIAGSGVKGYLYRYRSPASPEWTQWEEMMGPLAAVTGTEEGEKIHVQALAVDYEGNQSPMSTSTVEPKPTEVTIDSMAEPPPRFTSTADENLTGIVLEGEQTRSEPPVAEASIVNEEKLCDGRGSNPCGHYNGIDAAQYAYAWTFPGASDTEMKKLHNHEFQYFGGNGGDCANFVSQALWYGGMEFMGTHGLNNPDEQAKGDNSSIYERSEGAWWSAYHYVDKEPPKIFDPPMPSWWNSHELYVHLLEFGLAERISHTKRPRPGDLIFFNQGQGIHTQNIDHVQMITRVHGKYVQVSQHSHPYHKAFWKIVNKLENKYHQKAGVEKWNYFVLEPKYTAANLHEKSLGGIEE
jgi:hypothetical protein